MSQHIDAVAKQSGLDELNGSKIVVVSDYNQLITTGVFQAKAKEDALNPPEPTVPGRWYSICVLSVAGVYITQIAHSVTTNKLYIRGYFSNAWTAWLEITDLSAKATVVKNGWGAQVDVPSNHAIIMLNANVRIQVWLSGSAGVSIWFNRQPTSGQHIEYYKESASNTATFGTLSADGTEFTITRSGSTFSLTTNQNYTIKALY